MKLILENWELIALVLGFLWHVYKLRKQGKTTLEALQLAFNVLKDEAKMVDGRFSENTVKKLEEVAETIDTSKQAVTQVKQAMQGAEIDVKLGTYKGKPIYLSEALGIGAAIRRLKK